MTWDNLHHRYADYENLPMIAVVATAIFAWSLVLIQLL